MKLCDSQNSGLLELLHNPHNPISLRYSADDNKKMFRVILWNSTVRSDNSR